MLLFEKGNSNADLSSDNLREGVEAALAGVSPTGTILIIPPDITRIHSRAGELTRYIYNAYPDRVRAILPALGTHRPMDSTELTTMFGDIPQSLFVEHRWRTDCVKAGTVPAEFVASVSAGMIDEPIPASFNKTLFERDYGCIVSISQVVPHEVAGMAGYTKNLAVGLGGAENIHRTHFLGAAYGMERIMGRADSPVRRVLNYAVERFLCNLPIVHVITVLGMDADSGELMVRGLFIGSDGECYRKAAALSQAVNMHMIDAPLKKVVVYLDPREYKSTWLGNKSIYRTRMAIADGGELIVLAPGVGTFGEDPEIDTLIRQFGYRGTPATMAAVKEHPLLQNNLSAAAHLIHGSSEGRFSITYCAGGLTRKEVEGAGFGWAPVDTMAARYNPAVLSEGHNRMADGEDIYYISSPGSGLWAYRERFYHNSLG